MRVRYYMAKVPAGVYSKAWKLSISRCKVNSEHLCANLGEYVNGENVLGGVKCYNLLTAGILRSQKFNFYYNIRKVSI